uniref:(northern house mosquito) hypothetical protein n=1 Tax=Culex pipiens TaxID=7175 RepID=A0A8D8B546_CULPI
MLVKEFNKKKQSKPSIQKSYPHHKKKKTPFQQQPKNHAHFSLLIASFFQGNLDRVLMKFVSVRHRHSHVTVSLLFPGSGFRNFHFTSTRTLAKAKILPLPRGSFLSHS